VDAHGCGRPLSGTRAERGRAGGVLEAGIGMLFDGRLSTIRQSVFMP